MKWYEEEQDPEDIKDNVLDYFESVKKSKYDRYHSIISLFPEDGLNKKVLDYGCGWGHFSVTLGQKNYNVTGIDLSKNEIEICKYVWKDKNNVCFKNEEIMAFEESSFDYVLSNQVIEHVHNPGIYLNEINRVLKMNGSLIIALPNVMTPRFFIGLLSKNMKKNLVKLSQSIFHNYDKSHDHIQAWDPSHFVRLVSTVGFLLEDYIPMEGISMPSIGLFKKKKYLHLKGKRVKNLSYTMAFKFKKVSNSDVKPWE